MAKVAYIQLLFFCSLSAFINSQPPVAWVRSDSLPYYYTNPSTNTPAYGWLEYTDMQLDKAGNIFLAGRFSGVVDFNSSSASATLSTLGQSGSSTSQTFLMKLDAAGNFVWVKQTAVVSGYHWNVLKLAIDNSGNILLAGAFQGKCDFDPGPSSFTVLPVWMYAGYIQKLDPNGNLLWVKLFNVNNSGLVFIKALMTGPSNQVTMAGSFSGSSSGGGTFVDLDPGPSAANYSLFSSASVLIGSGFITSLDSMGNFTWGFGLNTSHSEVRALGTDGTGNVYCAGWAGTKLDLDPGNGTVLTSTTCGFVAKYSSTGSLLIGSFLNGSALPEAMARDQQGNLYLTGQLMASADLDPGVNSFIMNPASSQDRFIMRLDHAGKFKWAYVLPQVGQYGFLELNQASIRKNKLLIRGNLIGSYDVDPGTNTLTLSSTNTQYGWSDIALMEYDSLGSLQWAYSIGPCVNNYAPLAVDTAGSIFLAGLNEERFDLCPSSDTILTSHAQGYFIKKLSTCASPTLTLAGTSPSVTQCGPGIFSLSATGQGTVNWYPGPAGGAPIFSGTTFITPALFSDTTFYVGANTCAPSNSRIPIQVKIVPSPTVSVTASEEQVCAGQSIVLMASGANTYHWNHGLPALQVVAVIPGIGTTTYVVTGQSQNGCSASDEVVVNTVDCAGITEGNLDARPFLFPNPAGENISLELPAEANIIIYDVYGRVMISREGHAGINNIDTSRLAAGTYFVFIRKNEGQQTLTLVIR